MVKTENPVPESVDAIDFVFDFIDSSDFIDITVDSIDDVGKLNIIDNVDKVEPRNVDGREGYPHPLTTLTISPQNS